MLTMLLRLKDLRRVTSMTDPLGKNEGSCERNRIGVAEKATAYQG